MKYEDGAWYILYNTLPQLVELANDLTYLDEPETDPAIDLLWQAQKMLNSVLMSKVPEGEKKRYNHLVGDENENKPI